MENYRFAVKKEDSGIRLDKYLVQRGLPRSRSQIQKLIESGAVTVNSQHCDPSHHTQVGEVIAVDLPEPAKERKIDPEAIPLTVLYEDNDILVVNKPAGMVVHPAAGHYSGTLVNALLAHTSQLSGIGAPLRPGIVHRLDRDTSGTLVVAKNDRAYLNLVGQIKQHRLKRCYLALVHGHPGERRKRIETQIGRHPRQRKRMAVLPAGGREAITNFRVLEEYDEHSLLEVSLETGRTHQIRVHLSSRGFPIVGDKVYGSRRQGRSKSFVNQHLVTLVRRQALHAQLLGFKHPITGMYLEFTAPLPSDIQAAIDYLRLVKFSRTIPKN